MSSIRLLLFTFILILVPAVALHAEPPEAVIKRGATEFRIGLGSPRRILATLSVADLPPDYIHKQAFMWGGDVSSPPARIIREIKVRNDEDIYVPLSAYADLGAPARVSLKSMKDGFNLVIVGGDAAGSYTAILDFKNNEIVRRKVVSGEFPKQVWEETRYSFNHLEN